MPSQTKGIIIILVFAFGVGVLVTKSLIGSGIWKADQPKPKQVELK